MTIDQLTYECAELERNVDLTHNYYVNCILPNERCFRIYSSDSLFWCGANMEAFATIYSQCSFTLHNRIGGHIVQTINRQQTVPTSYEDRYDR